MSEPVPQRNLILILARNFPARLATAVFLIDAEGSVIYFNEAAERLLGQRFIEGHFLGRERSARQWPAAQASVASATTSSNDICLPSSQKRRNSASPRT